MIIENEKWAVRCEGAIAKGLTDRIAGGTKIGDTRIEPMRSDKSRGVENGLLRPAPRSGADSQMEHLRATFSVQRAPREHIVQTVSEANDRPLALA